MRRVAAAAAVVAVAVLVVIPVWGAPSNYSVPPLQDGDTLAVSCAGAQLNATVVDATHQTLTCTGVAPTTTQPTTTTSTTTSTTTTSTTTTAPTTTAPAGGVFTDGFANLNNWTFAHWASAQPGNASAPSTATVVGGQAQIVAVDQNYGDATLRSNTRYSLGEIRLTLSDDSGGFPTLGSAFVGLTTDPYNAPSTKYGNGEGATPANGILIHLRDNCRVGHGPPTAFTYVNHVETVTVGTCVGPMPTGQTEMRITNGHTEFWAAGAKYAEVNAATPATGYLMLGVHNHASLKYSDGAVAAVTGRFDNVTYPAAGTVSNHRNGVGVTNVGTSARVLFNAWSENFPTGAAVVVNGNSTPFTPYFPLSRNVAQSVPIPSSHLVVGNNTISVTGGFINTANVDLVVG